MELESERERRAMSVEAGATGTGIGARASTAFALRICPRVSCEMCRVWGSVAIFPAIFNLTFGR